MSSSSSSEPTGDGPDLQPAAAAGHQSNGVVVTQPNGRDPEQGTPVMGTVVLLRKRNRLVTDSAIVEYIDSLDRGDAHEVAAAFEILRRQNDVFLARLSATSGTADVKIAINNGDNERD